MKEWLVLSELYVPVKGGHVVWLHEVCRRAENVRLLTARTNGEATRENIDGVDVRRIPLGRMKMLRPESIPLYANLLIQGLKQSGSKKTAAIISARVLPEGVVGNVVGAMRRIPSVIFAHGEEINRLRMNKKLTGRRRITVIAKRRVLWWGYRHADLVIANSHFTAGLLVDGGIDPAKVAMVHPGTDPQRFRPTEKDGSLLEDLGLGEKRVILTVGRLSTRKGQDVVIQAMGEILRRIPNAIYIIGGTGQDAAHLRELAKTEGVADSVRFLGKISDDVLPKLYNLADVFIMANRVLPNSNDVEGFGIVFLEASACEIPVIGGNSGGVPDAIDDDVTGLLVDGQSQTDVAKAITRVLSDPALAERLGKAGRKRVCRELTWDHSAARIRNLISNL